MRRMIPQKLQDWIKSLKDIVIANGNDVEFGGDVEIDGDLQVNTDINADSNISGNNIDVRNELHIADADAITDFEGNPIEFGGGGLLTNHSMPEEIDGMSGFGEFKVTYLDKDLQEHTGIWFQNGASGSWTTGRPTDVAYIVSFTFPDTYSDGIVSGTMLGVKSGELFIYRAGFEASVSKKNLILLSDITSITMFA